VTGWQEAFQIERPEFDLQPVRSLEARNPAGEQLERHLDEVTVIKLQALEELSHEDLRGDRMFLIFLTHWRVASSLMRRARRG